MNSHRITRIANVISDGDDSELREVIKEMCDYLTRNGYNPFILGMLEDAREVLQELTMSYEV